MTSGGFTAEGPIPYLPSTRWMRCAGKGMTLKTRDFTRTSVLGNTTAGIVLTVPVVGGSSAVKRLGPDSLKISDHGDWPRIHLGAIDAAYGREPYFQHLFPSIASLIENHPDRLMLLNMGLMSEMIGFLDYENLMPEVEELRRLRPERCASIAGRIGESVDPEHSFLEALFRHGRDAIFLLPNE